MPTPLAFSNTQTPTLPQQNNIHLNYATMMDMPKRASSITAQIQAAQQLLDMYKAQTETNMIKTPTYAATNLAALPNTSALELAISYPLYFPGNLVNGPNAQNPLLKLKEQSQFKAMSTQQLVNQCMLKQPGVLMPYDTIKMESGAFLKSKQLDNTTLPLGLFQAVLPEAQIYPLKTAATVTAGAKENRDVKKVPQTKTKRCRTEWSKAEIIVLLQCARLMTDQELKAIVRVVYGYTKRRPGKCWGRAAEKKLKRLVKFRNWKTCDKAEVIRQAELRLKEMGAPEWPSDPKLKAMIKAHSKKFNDCKKNRRE